MRRWKWARPGTRCRRPGHHPDEARALLREWANGQHRLHRGDVERAADNPLGLSPDRHAEVIALTELGDNETVRTAAR
ncbi:hypothetical protein ACFW95_37225 [Streptomyces sp. NPDC059474]|uniref:hypothetical protein n=1 Tax=Streptomyces sp. NPDC059474 TaxID=3346846 RepID=UPI00367B411A